MKTQEKFTPDQLREAITRAKELSVEHTDFVYSVVADHRAKLFYVEDGDPFIRGFETHIVTYDNGKVVYSHRRDVMVFEFNY